MNDKQTEKPSVADQAKNLLKLTEPYLQAEGQVPRFQKIEDDILYITIESEKLTSTSEKHLIKLGIEKKILGELKMIKAVKLL